MTCERLRAEHRDWVAVDGTRAVDACCVFGGGSTRPRQRSPPTKAEKREALEARSARRRASKFKDEIKADQATGAVLRGWDGDGDGSLTDFVVPIIQ